MTLDRDTLRAHSGHMPHMEEPDRVNELVLNHFAEVDSVDRGGR
jgi:hypothetical protein